MPVRPPAEMFLSGLVLYYNCLDSKHTLETVTFLFQTFPPINVDIVFVESGHDANAFSPATVQRFQSKTLSEDDGEWKRVTWDINKMCYQLSETWKSCSRRGGFLWQNKVWSSRLLQVTSVFDCWPPVTGETGVCVCVCVFQQTHFIVGAEWKASDSMYCW